MRKDHKSVNLGLNENQTMIPTAYGKDILEIIKSYPVLIPSTTHGDQVAIEAYLRAMVKQFDYTQCHHALCEWVRNLKDRNKYFSVTNTLISCALILSHYIRHSTTICSILEF